MKRLIVVRLTLVLMSCFVIGNAQARTIGFKAEAFFQSSSIPDGLFKDLYGNKIVLYGGALSLSYKRLELRTGMSFAENTGFMTFSNEDLKFTTQVIFIGLRFRILEHRWLSPYVGAGINFAKYREDNPDRFDDFTSTNTRLLLETGLYVYLAKFLYLDANLTYSPLDIQPGEEVISLGKIRIGGGIGIKF